MQNYINTFGEICEFTFLDGPAFVKEKPIKYFVQKGIKPPYRLWARILSEPYRTLPDGKTELQINKSTLNYELFNETILYVMDHIN